MARNFKPTLPQPPSGFEDRVTRTEPRPVANDGSLIESRVWYANQKYYGSNIGKQDDNLCDRVKKVKKVINTTPHTIADYPGESAWFLKETAWTYLNAITLTLADGESVLVQAPAHGAYHSTIEYSVDKYNWAPVVVGQSYTGKLVDGFSGKMTAYNPITKKIVSITFETERDSDGDIINGTGAPATHMYAWEMTTPESEDPELAFTDTNKVTTATHLWAYNEEESTWVDMTEMAAEQGGSITIQSFTYGAGGELYLRGSLYSQNDCCPQFNGNATAIEKIEGNLAALVDWKGHNDVPSVNYQFCEIFNGCTALTDASKLVLPSELSKSATHVYARMFKNCTALVVAPNLSVVPVGTANNYVFSGTFNGCTALEVAPALPAVDVLPEGGFYEMFIGCTHLKSITVHIGTRIGGDGLLNWMNGAGTAVNGQCTFYHSGDFRWRYPSKSGIPGAARDNQKEWTPIPNLTTKLYFSAGAGGSVQAIHPGIVPTAIYSGESVEMGTPVTITAVADEGYKFTGWTTNTTGTAAVGNTITIESFPYGREEDGENKKEAIASFVKIGNLSVHYNEPPVGYTSDLAFVRNSAHDTTKGEPAVPMYAWTCVWFGDIFTESETPAAGYNIWTTDTQGLNWQKSDASYIRNEVFTSKVSVLVFDETSGNPGNITVLADGSTFHNWNRLYCACTATVGSDVTVNVALTEGEALNWVDGVTDNPRIIVPTLEDFGVTIRRVPSYSVEFSCTNGSVGAMVDGIGIQSGAQVLKDKSVVFTITPDSGYKYSGTNPETLIVSADVTKSFVCEEIPYLCITSTGASTVSMGMVAAVDYDNPEVNDMGWDVQYSLDNGASWTTLPSWFGTQPVISLADGESVKFRGTMTSSFFLAGSVGFVAAGSLVVSGDMTTLLNNGVGGVLDLTSYPINCFSNKFRNCAITSAADLVLPSTTLRSGCYSNMFNGCTSLTSAPDLPATTLAYDCYIGMFGGCTNLKGTVNISAASPYYEGTSSACGSMFFNAGTAEGAGGTINVGGSDAATWASAAGIDTAHWTIVPPTEDLPDVAPATE